MAFNRLILITMIFGSALSMSVLAEVDSTEEKVAEEKVAEEKVNEDNVTTSQAATTTSQTMLNKKSVSIDPKKFSATLDVSFETNSESYNSGESSIDTTNWLFLYYKIDDLYKARLWFSYNKNLSDSYADKVNDTKLTLSRKGYKLTEKLTLSPSVTGVIPTSDKSRRGEELQFGIEVNPSFGYKITSDLSFSYLPRMVKNFHEYETSQTNKNNTEFKLIQFYVLNYSLTEKIYVEGMVIYSDSWSYQGTQRDPSYLTGIELGYDYDKDLAFALGINTGGSVIDQEEGPDQNIEIYNVNNSTYYANVALKF